MVQCDGQISFMDLITRETSNMVPILLADGQTVFKVVRGDIEEHTVLNNTWTCGNDNRGYSLNGDVTWNTQINKTVFTDKGSAENVAIQYLKENEYISGADIQASEIVAYQYTYNDQDIINFYANIGNGRIYYHYGGMYEHIGKAGEVKEFEESRQKFIKLFGYKEIANYHPIFQNMYRCPKSDKWLYATARYNWNN